MEAWISEDFVLYGKEPGPLYQALFAYVINLINNIYIEKLNGGSIHHELIVLSLTVQYRPNITIKLRIRIKINHIFSA